MSDTATVLKQVVAVATISGDRAPPALTIVRQSIALATLAEQGPAGAPGIPGSAVAVVHNQTSASASWVIPHALGRRPFVQIMSNAGEQVFPDIVAGLTTVSVIFAQPQTGSAILL